MKNFKLEIATPDGMRYDDEAVQVSVRGIGGDLAVLAGHIPFCTALGDGECRIYIGEDGSKIKRASCGGGMLMVTKDCVRILSSDFEWKSEK
ncbi:MAG: F0F1 ATP synthase subunit epsilon [Ruminococcaceae bacterium]|nr:F0F1 ATP synthase subunit epsilon [Oscillospiraceae bacterium]